jgi:DNA polymerase-1
MPMKVVPFDSPDVTAPIQESQLAIERRARKWAKNSTLIVIDARHMAYRAWYTRDLTNSTGESTSAIHGIITMCSGICRDADTTRIVLAWDGRLDAKRAMHAGYKVRHLRDKTPEDQAESERRENAIRRAEAMTGLLGLPSIRPDLCEADDIEGFIAHGASSGLLMQLNGIERAVVVTDDKDVLQLLSPRVHVWRPVKQELVDLPKFQQSMGFPPSNYAHYKALCGESASGDNIPGVPGVGDKTAATQVAMYQTIDKIIAEAKHAVASGKSRAMERKIVAHEQDARLSLLLSTLYKSPSDYAAAYRIRDNQWPTKTWGMIDTAICAACIHRKARPGTIEELREQLDFGDTTIAMLEHCGVSIS